MDRKWKIDNGVATLYKESNAKKAVREGMSLIKKQDLLLSMQIDKKKLIEIFELNKDIGCYLCSTNNNYKVMEIITEEDMKKYIEQGIEYLNKIEEVKF